MARPSAAGQARPAQQRSGPGPKPTARTGGTGTDVPLARPAVRPAAAAPPARRVPDPGPEPPPHDWHWPARSPRTGYAQQACLNAATRPGLRSVCGGRGASAAGPGTRWIRPGSPTCRPGWATCPPPRCAARPPAAGGRRGWQSRRTVDDHHLPGDHRFHQHLGDVGGVAAGEDDLRLRLHRSLRKAQHWPGPTLTLRRPDVGCRPTGTASSR